MQTIEAIHEFTFDALRKELWQGGSIAIEEIARQGKQNEFMDFLTKRYCVLFPTITEINDLLWFQTAKVYKSLGIEVRE